MAGCLEYEVAAGEVGRALEIFKYRKYLTVGMKRRRPETFNNCEGG
jgi:hypothetical protein